MLERENMGQLPVPVPVRYNPDIPPPGLPTLATCPLRGVRAAPTADVERTLFNAPSVG